MSKLGKRLIAAAREDSAIVSGEADPATYRIYVPAEIDVRKIRRQLGFSQDEFAAKFGLSAATVREWEQDRRKPEGAARVLLTVIEREPEAVTRALIAAAAEMSKNVTGKTVRYHRDDLPVDNDTDRARVMAMNDEEIMAAAKADPDAQLLTPQQLARMRRASDTSQPKRKRRTRASPQAGVGLQEEGRPYTVGRPKDRKH